MENAFPDYHFYLLAGDTCDLTEHVRNVRPNCDVIFNILKSIDLNKFDYLITGIRMVDEFKVELIKNAIDEVTKNYRGKIIYVGPVPYYGTQLMDAVYLRQFNRLLPISPNFLEYQYDRLLDATTFKMQELLIEALKHDEKYKYLSSLQFFCSNTVTKCKHLTALWYPILIDLTHLTPEASGELVNYFKQTGQIPFK